MPQHSPFKIEIPASNILTYIFPDNIQPSDRPIWIDANDTSNSLSPKQLLGWAKRLGVGLDRLGIGQNETIAMFTSNHIFVPVLYLGVAGAGRVFTGCNPTFGIHETAYQLENTGAKLVLVEPQFLETVLEAAKKINFPRENIYLFDDKSCAAQEGIQDWRTILGSELEARNWNWPRLSPAESKTKVAVLNYSSGTTGVPKGVMLSHHNIIANVEQSLYMRNLEQPYPPGYGPPERWLGFLPLYHVFGQLWSITAAVKNNSAVYFMRKFRLKHFLQNVQSHRITHIQTAPPVLVMLAKRLETRKFDLSSLKNILCGAAPLSKELQNEVSDKFNLSIAQTWGMTELTCSCMHTPGGRDDRSGSVGYIDPNSEVKLVDENGKEVKAGERGELCVRGPNVCLGYHRNQNATQAAFDSDSFLRSGDIAIRDNHGWFWIVDRKKELIKVSGFQVAPAELEAVLLENDSIADAAVVALKVGYEELPRAYVVLKPHAKGSSTEVDIQQWVSKQVAKHKRLTGGVKFVDEVPKSPSGKIQRVIIREWARHDAEEMNGKPLKARL